MVALPSAPPAVAVHPGWVDRAVQGAARVPRWSWVAVLAALLASSWAAVYGTGGSQLSAPHLFYVPIVLAALPFGLRGSLSTAVLATILSGPLVPLVVATSQPQTTASWLARGVMFLAIGAIASLAVGLRQRSLERALTTDVRAAITAEAPHHDADADADLVALVGEVLDAGRFHPVFQPIYSLTDGRLLAVEALARFDVEPYRTPDRWFAAADAAGCGLELEVAAVRAALDHLGAVPPDVQVSLNVSPRALEDDRLLDLLASHKHRRIVLEITEHAIVEDYRRLLRGVDAVRALGVTIAVDDAGSGFASLRHVVQLAPETIKLDMSLTQDLAASPLRRALAGALVEFARNTGAQLVVEGVETVADLRAWSGLGAHAVQGYLLGRPGPLPAPRTSPAITHLHHHTRHG